jgi:hypothetical protein
VKIKDLYSIIVTDKRAECRDFYVCWFGFQVVFEASWFVYLTATGDHAFGIAFMAPDHPSQPPGPETFSGQGMFLTSRSRMPPRNSSARGAGVWRSRTRCVTSHGVSGASACTTRREHG